MALVPFLGGGSHPGSSSSGSIRRTDENAAFKTTKLEGTALLRAQLIKIQGTETANHIQSSKYVRQHFGTGGKSGKDY